MATDYVSVAEQIKARDILQLVDAVFSPTTENPGLYTSDLQKYGVTIAKILFTLRTLDRVAKTEDRLFSAVNQLVGLNKTNMSIAALKEHRLKLFLGAVGFKEEDIYLLIGVIALSGVRDDLMPYGHIDDVLRGYGEA